MIEASIAAFQHPSGGFGNRGSAAAWLGCRIEETVCRTKAGSVVIVTAFGGRSTRALDLAAPFGARPPMGAPQGHAGI
jgi:hypothetical protein